MSKSPEKEKLKRKDMNENSFTIWWENNKGSDDLRERYDNCMLDIKDVEPDFKQTFKQWAKEVWESEQGI